MLGLGLGESRHEDSGVGEEDAVHGETGSLNGVLVHIDFFLSIIINLIIKVTNYIALILQLLTFVKIVCHLK